MRMILIGVALVVLMLTQGFPARAEGLPATVPAKLAKRLATNPQAVVAAAGDLIHGHGTGGAIDRQGIAQAVAMDRAGVRARAVQPLLSADLDADGQVTGPEMATVAAAAGAAGRGRLMRAQAQADGDGDGTVSRTEVFAYADAQAMARVDAADEARLMAYLTLDLDGDGRLTLAEVEAAAERAAVPAAAVTADKDA